MRGDAAQIFLPPPPPPPPPPPSPIHSYGLDVVLLTWAHGVDGDAGTDQQFAQLVREVDVGELAVFVRLQTAIRAFFLKHQIIHIQRIILCSKTPKPIGLNTRCRQKVVNVSIISIVMQDVVGAALSHVRKPLFFQNQIHA